ncbi:membrane protein [Asticcacaulis biprosthecium C19]|uniref:Membrane protein n=1 Tax=Asticcacaulis biprosthecium C19 TaxID=715226 RepID=F4QTV8_9CAUL|nr:outer membrane beta-barrel protein [Asticcacaulis biprosthecium]EGF89258.1 membrane protein [Asticcacaulis biprosthecium C19]
MQTTKLTVTLIATGMLAAGAPAAWSQDWAGPYVGVAAGMSNIADDNETVEFDTNLDGAYGDTVNTFAGANAFSPGFCTGAANGRTPGEGCAKQREEAGIGLRAGYDWQVGNWVFGVVGEVTNANFEDSVTAFSTTPANYVFTRDIENINALRGKAGYVMGDWQVYLTAGYAQADIERTFRTSNALNSFTATDGDDSDGYQVGLGIEQRISGRWIGGIEYLRTSLKDEPAVVVRAGPSANTFNSNPFLIVNSSGTDMRRTSDKIEIDTLRLSLRYQFGG